MNAVVAPRHWAVIPAAGKGARMGAPLPKQYLRLLGQTILEHTLARLHGHPLIDGVSVAVAPDDELWPEIAARWPAVRRVWGGAERCHSVLNALRALGDELRDHDWVLVHDAARPCLHADDVTHLIGSLRESPHGGLLGTAVRDTLKRCGPDGQVVATVDRADTWHALTPQMFRYSVLRDALERALARGDLVTDEAQAIELAGGTPRLVPGRADNLKITRPEDLVLAECFMRAQAEGH